MNVTLQKLSVSFLSHSPYFASIKNFNVRDTHFSFQAKPFFVSSISKNFKVDKSSFQHYLTAIYKLDKDSGFLTCSDTSCSIENTLFSYASGEPTQLNVNSLSVVSCSFNNYQTGILYSSTAITSLTYNRNCIYNLGILSTATQKSAMNLLGQNSMTNTMNQNALYTENPSTSGTHFFNIKGSVDCEYLNYTGAKSFTFIRDTNINSGAEFKLLHCQFYSCSFNNFLQISGLQAATDLKLQSDLFYSVKFIQTIVINNPDESSSLSATFASCGFFQISASSVLTIVGSQGSKTVTGAYIDPASSAIITLLPSEIAGNAYSSYISSQGFTLPQEAQYLTQYCHISVTPTPTRSISPTPSNPPPSVPPQTPEETMPPESPTASPITLEPGFTIGVSVAIAIGSLAIGIIVWFAIRPFCFTRKYPYLHYDF
ncbi:hypothetical protein TVAG_440140 [Trichomonas vaginalis G3]|uniref:Uncharacterized protein n=1 Tax=Trichomonas vaginalis (strain ATCC PRA-98 / G3) TaxID=412133 RepID=A2FDL7_TRIV3|nr:hypothetical protein TVAGG3_0952570 [Trichomonas vaginalis G3]EAX96998.1 hypothetical protein TVAG_440140 [Trichomonas vaginalis G3]KAI5487317.1 hypothetical protein TVAGG3_0952570 [Trichomonas vaginalis G3]|eukprot:XP_001309928.1 hypothetical protein [Trichomonas vaginalis G3]